MFVFVCVFVCLCICVRGRLQQVAKESWRKGVAAAPSSCYLANYCVCLFLSFSIFLGTCFCCLKREVAEKELSHPLFTVSKIFPFLLRVLWCYLYVLIFILIRESYCFENTNFCTSLIPLLWCLSDWVANSK